MPASRTIIINAAGIGSRLGMNIPKALIKIYGKPLINWTLNALKKEKNIRIVVGYKAIDVIKHISKIRKDIIFVNNKNFFKTGTASSFLLGCNNLSKTDVVSIDGDLLFNKSQINKILNSKNSCIGVTKPNTENAIYVKEKIIKNMSYHNGFTKLKTNYEWSGIFKINSKKLNINDKSFHVYEMLNKIKINFLIHKIKSMDFDTPNDYMELKKNFYKIYY